MDRRDVSVLDRTAAATLHQRAGDDQTGPGEQVWILRQDGSVSCGDGPRGEGVDEHRWVGVGEASKGGQPRLRHG